MVRCRPHQLEDRQRTVPVNRDFAIIVEGVSTDGFMISSLVTFKAKLKQKGWIKEKESRRYVFLYAIYIILIFDRN